MKGRLFRNDKYMDFVRGYDSCVSWGGDIPIPYHQVDDWNPIVVHHVRMGCNGGVGVKPSDYRTVPLTTQEHLELHQGGEAAFWRRRKVDPDIVIIALLVNYVADAASAAEISLRYRGDPKGFISALEDLAEAERPRGRIRQFAGVK